MSNTHTTNCMHTIQVLEIIAEARREGYVAMHEWTYIISVLPCCKVCYDQLMMQRMGSGRLYTLHISLAKDRLVNDVDKAVPRIMDMFVEEDANEDE